MSKKEFKKVSFFNWILTLFVSLIPGLNLIFFLFVIGCARNPSKKTFGVAALVLALIITIALCVLVFCFGDTVAKWATDLLKTTQQAAAAVA